MAKLPLEGIRIVELCPVWAGPFCCMLLADWGAEVIKVESMQHFPVYSRGLVQARPPVMLANQIWSGYTAYMLQGYDPAATPWNRFVMYNCHARNKLGMTVNLRQPEGKEIFKRLVKVSDVVIESNSPRVTEELGLTYDVLKEVKPDLIPLWLWSVRSLQILPGIGRSPGGIRRTFLYPGLSGYGLHYQRHPVSHR